MYRLFLIVFVFLAATLSAEVVSVKYDGIWKFIQSSDGKTIKVINIPDVRQSTEYTCGVSSLQAVLGYWGIEYREGTLAQMACSNSESGTPPGNIVSVAKTLGFDAEVKQRCTIADIEKWIEAGIPVIVDIQAWKDAGDTSSWRESWENGHYVVAIGYDEKNIYFEEPSILGAIGFTSKSEFLDRWHDYEGNPPFDPQSSKITENLAIVIKGHRPGNPDFIQRID